MNLTKLDLQRSKGLSAGYRLEGLSPGFNVIIGANGSGKSSLSRAIAALLWETRDFSGSVEGTWDVGGRKLAVLRESGAAPRWGTEGQPPLPDKRFRGCFSFSVDEFLNDESTESEIERAIRTELLAGFDLSKVLSDRKSNPASQTARKLKSDFVSSRRSGRMLAATHEDLLFEEQKLGEKHVLKEQAIDAGKRVQLLELAESLGTKRAELAESAASFEEFPASMQALHSGTRRSWDAWKAEGARCEETARNWQAKLEAAEEELKFTGLDAHVGSDQLELLGRHEGLLRAQEQELRGTQESEAVAAGRLQEARRALKGLQPARSAGADPFAELEAQLIHLAELESRMARAAEEVEGGAGPDDDTPDAPYVEGIGILGRWLQTTNPSEQASWLPIALGALGLLLGALQFTESFAGPMALFASAVMIGLAVHLWLQSKKEGRGHMEGEFERLFGAGSLVWRPEAVAERMEELQGKLLRQERQRATCEDRQRAERRLSGIQDEHGALAQELSDKRVVAGLPPDTSRLRLVEVADQLRRQIDADHAFAEATARKETARAAKAEELATANRVLAQFGMSPVDNAEDMRAATDSLRERSANHTKARERVEEAKRSLQLTQGQLTENHEAREEFLKDLELGDAGEGELLRRLDRLEQWEELSQGHAKLQTAVQLLEKQLEEHPELLEYDALRVTQALAESRALEEQLQPLNVEIAALANKIEKAQDGHEITDALDDERRKRDDLADLRDELLEGAAADLLLAGVAGDHQRSSQPDILREAAELFAEFTRNRYELFTATYSEGALPFEIRETDGVKKEITELSSGTRSQLGLALRVAVAKSVELGEPLPLVLDEALTNSDPERFREVVRSLNQMVEVGRQILFMTSDPADAARLEDVLKELDAAPARTYDLDEMRGEARASESLTTMPLPSVPAPDAGESIDTYAKRLGVPGVDAFAGVDALHLYYLCGDDSAGLHQLLQERVETVGKALDLLGRSGRGTGRSAWNAEQRAKLEARRDVAAQWLDHYKVGRAPRLYPEVLREGPLAKSSYLEALIEVNEQFDGSARALIEAIDAKPKDRDPGLKGFRQNKRDELCEDLERRGLFTEDEVLSPADRTERCLAAGAVHLDQGTLSREEVVQLANAFEQWVGPARGND